MMKFLSFARLLVTLCFLFFLQQLKATNYYSAGNNAPNTTANWWTNTNGTGGHPSNFSSSADVFIIQSGHTMTTSANWAVNGTIQVNSGAILVVSNSVSAATAFTVAGGGMMKYNRNGSTIPAAAWATGSTCEITGLTNSSSLSGLNQSFSNLTFNSTAQTGNLTLNASLSVAGNLNIVTCNTGSIRVSGNGTSRTVTVGGNFSQSGTGEFRLNNGNGSVTMSVAGNFSLSGSAKFTIVSGNANSSVTVGGSVSINGAGVVMDMCQNNGRVGTLNVAGDYSFMAGTITETASGSGTINFNGSAAQTYTSGGTVSNTINYNVLNGATLNMAATGTTVNGAGTFTLNTGATLGITSTVGITSNPATATGNIRTTGGRSFSTGANYNYIGTTNQTDLGTGFPTNLTGILTINNPGNTVTLTAARTIANGGAIHLLAGTFACGTNLSLATTSSITRNGGAMTGALQGAGTYNVTFNGSSVTAGSELSGSGLNNITMNMTAGQSVTLNASKAIPGTLTLTSGSFIIPAGLTFTISNGTAIGGSGFDATKSVVTQVNTGTGAQGFLRVNNITAGTSYSFPVSDGTNYLPVTLALTGATVTAQNSFSVCNFNGITANGTPNGTAFSAGQKAKVVDAIYTVNYNGTGTPNQAAG
ncbi:MAG: hypothetical protein JST86_05380, partial [Bacteroidetes bacterium]|nr:hypothetical protein [Bacteroidota bacterium]